MTLTFQPRAFQSRTLQFRPLTLAQSPSPKFLLRNWSNLGSSQQSGRVWEAFPHSPSHRPGFFPVQWNRKGDGFSSLPSISGGCPSLCDWGFPGFLEFGDRFPEDHLYAHLLIIGLKEPALLYIYYGDLETWRTTVFLSRAVYVAVAFSYYTVINSGSVSFSEGV